jgi:hypothetical protein
VALSLAFAAAVSGSSLSDPAPADDKPKEFTLVQELVRVHVERVWAKPGMASDANKGMAICSRLEVAGMEWNPPEVEVRLRTPDGTPVRAAADSPDGYADKNGLFYMGARLPVLDHTFQWPELCASFPHETVLDVSPGRRQRLIASVRASMDELSSVSEVEIPIPPERDGDEKRALRLLDVDAFCNAGPPRKKTGSAETEESAGPVVPAGKELGLKVWGYVEAVGLDRSTIVARLSIRSAEGEPPVSKDPETVAKRRFESRVEQEIVPDQLQFLLHFVPYGEVGLKPGRHRLILSYSVSCKGLSATLEELCVVQVAASQPAAP